MAMYSTGRVVNQLAATPWPYRSVSAPITTMLGLYAAAGVVYYIDAPWYWVAFTGIFAAVVSGMACIIAGLARTAAVYATVTMLAAAMWGSWTAATTPYSLTAVGILVTGGVLMGPFFGVLRYLHNAGDDAAVLGVLGRGEDLWVAILDRAGYPGSTITRTDTGYGYRLTVQVSVKAMGDPLTGDTAKKLEQHAAAVLPGDDRIKRGAISLEPGLYANEIVVHVNTADIFATDLTLPDDHTPRSITDPIELGRYIDTETMEITFPRDVHMKIVGMTGSGKSVLLNNLIHGVTRCTDALVWMSATDKGIPIVSPWLAPFAAGDTKYPLLDWASIDIPESARMLMMLYKAADLRSRTPRGGKSKLTICRDTPAIVGIFEEAPGLLREIKRYPTHNGRNLTASELLHEVTRLGRSEAVYAVVLSQYGTGEMLGADGPKMKANFGACAGLRTASSRENPYVFPDDNVPLHRLCNPGEVYLSTRATKRPKLGRGFALEDDLVAAAAREHSRYRPTLEADIAAALGPAYTDRWSNTRAGGLMDVIRSGVPAAAVCVAAKPEPEPGPSEFPALPAPYVPAPRIDPDAEPTPEPALPALPARYLPRKADPEPAPADPADVERMLTQAEDLLRSSPALTDAEKRSKLIELLEAAGPAGIRTSELQTRLQDACAYPARGTFFRWLGEVATQVRHGVWALDHGRPNA